MIIKLIGLNQIIIKTHERTILTPKTSKRNRRGSQKVQRTR